MKSTAALLMALVLTAAFSASAWSKPGGPMFGGGPGFGNPEYMLEHMADYLDLDDAQRQTVSNIIEAHKPEIQALREQARSNRETLESLDQADPAYETTLNNVALSNGELATQGTLLTTRLKTEISAVLTDEQREKLERGKERMKRRFEDRFERRQAQGQ